MTDLSRLSRALGYTFRDSSLLQTALTHSTFGRPHNQRLEFLGDSVLNLSVSRLLFEQFTDIPEGDLSRLRAGLVREGYLAHLASTLEIGPLLRLGVGLARDGGAQRPSILADALEAVLGAVLQDGGYDAAFLVVHQLFAARVARIDPERFGKDPKSLLKEWAEGRKLVGPSYHVAAVSGMGHAQEFEMRCELLLGRAEGGKCLFGVGRASSRRAAEQAAACEVLHQLGIDFTRESDFS